MMKRIYTLGLILSFLIVAVKGYSYDFQSNGIYYSIDGNNVAVTSGDTKYKGEIVIPEKVTYYVISEIQNPFKIKENVFSSDTYSKATLTVPSGTKSKYQQTNFWNKFTNIVETSSTSSGEWKDVTTDFDKSLPFTKIRVKNTKVSNGNYCCVFFSIQPNDSGNSDTQYSINFYTLILADGASQGYIYGSNSHYIKDLTPIGDNWYEYEFKQPVYFSHYQSNAPKNQLKVFVGGTNQDTSTKRTIHVATAGTLPNLIPESEKYIVEELTLTGELNGTDFRLLRDMAGNNYIGQNTEGKLKMLDLSGAKVVTGGEKYLDTDRIIGNGISASLSFHYQITQVNEIPMYVFYGCYLKNILIPNFVTSIEESAFSYCRGLTSITIPNSVTSIGSSAFEDCSGLTSISIPNSVTSIGEGVFSYCSGLTSISIPNSVTSIGNSAFSSCSRLTSIKVESGNTIYDSRNNCNAIIRKSNSELIAGCKNTVIPNSVTSIGNYAFYNCSGLTSISIPNSVTSIGSSAFEDCSGLTSISIPNSVTSIGEFAFYGCTGLTSISIPNSVTSIGNYAFSSCSGLTSIKVESGNTIYDSRNNCNAIIRKSNNELIAGCKTTVIPNSVTSIGSAAFSSCSGLTSISIPNSVTSIGNSAFSSCSGLTSISIPNSVTSIGNYAFFSCSGLTSISIPNSVTSIGNYAFSSCSGLKDIISEIKAPFEINENVFSVYSTATLTVPQGMKSTYQSTAGWNKFTNIAESTSNNQKIAEPIDLGLSVKWASWNIGASKPEEYGSYFSWGETSPKSNYAWSTYKFVGSQSKYNSKDNKKTLDPSDDAAVVLWGDKWRMPTNAEEKELYEKCKWTYTRRNGINGYQVTGPNGNSIFLPAAGIYDGNSTLSYANSMGWYWSSTSSSDNYALGLYLTTAKVYYSIQDQDKCDGHVIRPIYAESSQSQSIVITAKSYTREYGDTNPTLEYTVSGGSISGTPKITCSATKTSSVGTYTIKIEKGSITNSNVKFVDGTLTITKAPLIIMAKSYTRKQGEPNPTFEVTYSGFKNGETSSVLTKKPTCSTTATSSSAPGTYDINVSGASATNYDFSYVKGKLTVTKADAVTITARSYTREYGDANPSFEYTVSGGTISGTPKITCSATKTSSVGTYTIKIEKGSITNSNVKYVDGTLTITKAPLTITAKSYTRKQGESNPTFDVTYSGFKNNETSSVLTRKPTCSTTATVNSSPGTYDITVYGAEAKNYSISYVKGTLTITEKSEVSFTYQGITYIGTTSTLRAEVYSISSDLINVDIPSTVSYNGRTYQVTSIASGVLSNRTFNYVSLPSTITSISYNTFSNSILGALIWNANTSLLSSVFSYMSMPVGSNFLLYVNSKSYAPTNVSNVIVGSSASSIILTDGTNTRFYCPKAFTAQTISYTHHYGMTTGGNGKGWETIALPFDVQRIEHGSKGVLTPFAQYSDMMTQRPFWLYELGSNGFRKTDGIKSNTPYIIAMPNDSKYDSDYILAGDVTFSATNATVAKTESLTKPTSNGKTFVPAFAVVNSQSSVYVLNVHNNFVSNYSSYDAGSRFISNLRSVYPFEAYMTTSSYAARALSIEFEDGTTGIDEIPSTDNDVKRSKVYSLGGQLLIDSEQSDWESLWQQLPAGVYIVNGKKVIRK